MMAALERSGERAKFEPNYFNMPMNLTEQIGSSNMGNLTLKAFRDYCMNLSQEKMENKTTSRIKKDFLHLQKTEGCTDDESDSVCSDPRPRSLPIPLEKNVTTTKPLGAKLSFGIDEILSNKRSKIMDEEQQHYMDKPTAMKSSLNENVKPETSNNLAASFVEMYEKQYKLYKQYLLSGLGQRGYEMMNEYYRLGGFVPEESYKKLYATQQQLYNRQSPLVATTLPRIMHNTAERAPEEFVPVDYKNLLFNHNQISVTDLRSRGMMPNVPMDSVPGLMDGSVMPSQLQFYRTHTSNHTTYDTNHSSYDTNQDFSPRRRRKWKRAVFSLTQRKGLENSFKFHKYVTKPERRKLAETLQLSENQVKIWYQNRRMKWRQSCKPTELVENEKHE